MCLARLLSSALRCLLEIVWGRVRESGRRLCRTLSDLYEWQTHVTTALALRWGSSLSVLRFETWGEHGWNELGLEARRAFSMDRTS
jgi:hypothetical protein